MSKEFIPNTTVWNMQKYIKQEYGIDFKLKTYPCGDGELIYNKGKITYNLHCDYAQSNVNDPYEEYWSIYHDYMDYGNWHGVDGAYLDEGTTTIDRIMQEWGFDKKKQINIFDFIGSD